MTTPTPGPPPNCPYDLSLTPPPALTLRNGRTLSYAIYGTPHGTPILYMPGFPSSRIEGAGLDPEATALGARIIAIDRPGYGDSSPHAERSVISCASDVKELTEHLGLERYGVLGISGGGPYALACARVLPAEKLKGVSIVCGLGSPDMGYWGMKFPNYLGWTIGQRYFPGLCRWWFSREAGARLDLSEGERMGMLKRAFEKDRGRMHGKDVGVLGDESFMWMHLRRSKEVYKQGMGGMSSDFKTLNSPWGFRIEDIRKDVRVSLWHGKLDDMVPLQHAEKIKMRLGDGATLRICDETHASIWKEKKGEYLRELVEIVNEK